MGRPFDPLPGIVTALVLFALLAAGLGATLLNLWLLATGRLARPDAPPSAPRRSRD